MSNDLFYPRLKNNNFGTIYFEDSQALSIKWEDGRLEDIQSGADKGIGVHLQVGEASYYSHQDGWDLGSLKVLLSGILKNLPQTGSLESVRPGIKVYSHKIRKKPSETALSEKIEVLRKIDSIIKSHDPRIKQVIVNYGEKDKKIRVVNPDGTLADERRVYVVLGIVVIASSGSDIQTSTEVLGGISGFEFIENLNFSGIADRAAKLAVNKLEAPYMPAHEMPVVIGSEAGGTMIHEAIGHSLEADLVQKGISPHFAGRKGKKVACELVSIADDPTLPGRRGSYFIDDEGVESSKCVLVEDGILKDYLYDRFTASKDNVPSNSHGRRDSFQSKPIPRMSNTFIMPGKSKREEIVRSIARGLFVKKMGGGQVNTATGDFVFEVEEGYMIEDGQVKNLVRGATLLGNGPRVLMDIDMVADDLGWAVGTCGKEGQGVPVSDGQPTLKIKNILVGGVN